MFCVSGFCVLLHRSFLHEAEIKHTSFLFMSVKLRLLM
jgi:hypothetical protein